MQCNLLKCPVILIFHAKIDSPKFQNNFETINWFINAANHCRRPSFLCWNVYYFSVFCCSIILVNCKAKQLNYICYIKMTSIMQRCSLIPFNTDLFIWKYFLFINQFSYSFVILLLNCLMKFVFNRVRLLLENILTLKHLTIWFHVFY